MRDQLRDEAARGSYPDAALLALPGVDRMRAAIEGRGFPKPPIHHLAGLIPTSAEEGAASFTTPATGWLTSHSGFFTGGVLVLAADAALGGAVMTALDAGEVLSTSYLSMNFLRPAGPWSERLTANGRLVHRAKTVGLSEVAVEDGGGDLLAHGASRCFVMGRGSGAGPSPDLVPVDAPEPDTPDPYLRPVEGEILGPTYWHERSGLEFLRDAINGDVGWPPVSLLIGHAPVAADEGAVTWHLPAAEWLCAPEARVYGGVIGLFAHDALVTAVQTLLPAGTTYATLDFSVHFLRPVAGDGSTLEARGQVIHHGRTMAVATCQVNDQDNKRVATATGSVMILANRDWPRGPHDASEVPRPPRASYA